MKIAVILILIVFSAPTNALDGDLSDPGSNAQVAWAQAQPELGTTQQPIAIQNATAFEVECAQAAMAYVLSTYRRLGVEPPPDQPFRIVFQERVTVDGRVLNDVLGRYDSRDATVYMLQFESAAFQETDHMGLPDLPTKFRLVIAHEIAHFLNSLLAVPPNPVLDECIAGYVQFAWLEHETINQLLAKCPGYEIDTLVSISMLAYRRDPNAFLLGGYRYFSDHPVVLTRCLNGNPPPVRDPFMVRSR